MTILRNLAGTILLTFLISCGQEINPDEILKKETELKLTIHSKANNASDNLTTSTIFVNSEVIIKMKDWLTRNPDGWQNSIASWATPDISVTGKNFRMLIFENVIVIGFTDKTGKEIQYTKQIEKKEFDFLTENK